MALTTFQATAIAYAAALLLSWLWSFLRGPGFRVAGRHVLITGGSSGLGLALAKKYALAGAKVTVIARDPVKLEAAKRQIDASYCSDREQFPVYTHACDVTDYAAVQAAVAAANAFHHRITDHVICNAGESQLGLLLDQEPAQFRATLDVNYFGVLHTVKATLPAMVQHPLSAAEPRRRVVFVCSAAGLIGLVGISMYASTKFAVRGLAEAMRSELQLYDIDTSIFYPGFFESPLLERDDAVRSDVNKLVSKGSSRHSAEQVANALIAGVKRGQYAITNESILFALRTLSNGITPRVNRPLELLLMPLLFVIELVYLSFVDWAVKRERSRQKRL